MKKMSSKLQKEITIRSSRCDNTAKLAYPEIFKLFMDLTAIHATELGYGAEDLDKKGLFWIISKVKIKIYDRPKMSDDVIIATWPEKPDMIRCNRFSTIASGENILVEGKTEWLMIEKQTGKIHRVADAYPMDMEHLEDKVCNEAFIRVNKEDFISFDREYEHLVKSTDIDFIQHMNNVAYIRLVMELFSCKELEELSIKEMEVCYKEQCHEGDLLKAKVKKEGQTTKIGIFREDKLACSVVIR